jgi:hypothetical protein
VSCLLALEALISFIREVPPGCDDGTEPDYLCYAYADDFNLCLDAASTLRDCVLDAYAVYKVRTGSELPEVARALDEASALLSRIPRQASAELVRAEDRTNLVLALAALERAVAALERALGLA